MSRFLRMAVVAGVESAVQIHIDRGDDINARDDKGRTPLMLSAARNKVAICKLLLAAGADIDLLDPLGESALDIALATGAIDAAKALQAADTLQAVRCGTDRLGQAPPAVAGEIGTQLPSDLPAIQPSDADSGQRTELLPSNPGLEASATPDIELVSNEDGGEFDLTGWEEEEDHAPPESDSSHFGAAFEVQSVISEHRPIDTSADWDDIDAYLPDYATPLQVAGDVETHEQLRLVLLRAIREGSVPQSAVNNLVPGEDGGSDFEASALLGMVINDLGAETDERFEYSAPHESFEVFVAPDGDSDEEDMVAEAIAFMEDLASRRNEPLRIYQREFQRESLLTAEAEVALGQAMERGIDKALDALAAWPAGVCAVLEAARRVASGAMPLRWLSSGLKVEAVDNLPTPDTDLESEQDPDQDLPVEAIYAKDDGDSRSGHDTKAATAELAAFYANVERLSGLAINPSQDRFDWDLCRGALTSLCLSRGFLMELADSRPTREPVSTFTQAIKAFRRARDQMTNANAKLVYSIAKKYTFSSEPLDDLLQEGNIGLIKAVDRYDWRRGFKFSTYATWWIRQQVGRYVADKGRVIRLPVHIYEKTQRIAQAARAFEFRHGHSPSVEEIGGMVGLHVHKVTALIRTAQEPLQLHELHSLDDLIAADAKEQFTARDPIEIVEDLQLIDSVNRFLGTLKRKEEHILRMRFGIGNQEAMTLDEIGARLEVTRERIRQIEANALRWLKNPTRLDRFLRELNGSPPEQPNENVAASSDPADGAPTADTNALAPHQKIAAKMPPRHGSKKRYQPTALDKILDKARAIGIVVEDYLEGASRRIWVHITDTSDIRSRKLVRNLIELGFEFWPGKGYWR